MNTAVGGTPDTTVPTVAITAPANGATVSGSVTVSANASDNVAVAGVQFKVDGANVGSEDTAAPYSVVVGQHGGDQRLAHADSGGPRYVR